MPGDKKILLVALGGNALIKKGQTGTVKEQFDNLRRPVRRIAKLSDSQRVIITHGNGPQVGSLLLMQERSEIEPKLPLEILVAQTQGWLGYMIESTLDTELMNLNPNNKKRIVSLISYVVVDPDDPAFKNPEKPIGPSFTREQAKSLPYPTRETAKGFRRVAASPRPVTIVEKREIKKLIDMDFIVICCGGGGIPVIRNGRTFCGVNAVIDKDLASAKLAEEVGADLFVMATDTPGAALDFGGPNQRFLREITVSQALKHLGAGAFPPGSMGPKIEAAVSFVEKRKGRAVICHTSDIEAAVKGLAGTEITS